MSIFTMQSNKTCKGRGYLLEDLAGLAGCDYLSDLRCAPSFRYPIFVALSLLFAEDYSVKEWTDAVKYIVDETAVFSSAKEAYAFLRNHLQKRLSRCPDRKIPMRYADFCAKHLVFAFYPERADSVFGLNWKGR